MSTKLQSYIKYWQQIFSSDDPIKALRLYNFEKEMSLFDLDVPPEPYYGYFHEDMTDDVLLLLFNPGTKEKRTGEDGWNQSVKKRYTELWTKKRYEEEELRIKEESNWRHTYLESAKNIVGNAGFLHKMEFFPFHSQRDLTSKKFKDRWINHESSELAFQALKDIAINQKVKQILTVNEIWPLVLEKHNVPLTHHVELFRRGGKAF